MSAFENCWKRIERANAHREAFADAWNKVADKEDSYSPLIRVNDDGTGHVWIEPVHLFGFPPDASLELGEMLYQLRAALDGSIYASAISESGKNPPPKENCLEFPICTTRAKFSESAWKLGELAQKQRDIIESVQPYDIDKLAPNETVHDHSRNLWLINEWARKDRHRRLHFVGSWAIIGKPKLKLPEGVSLVSMVVNDSGFLEHDSQIAEFRLDGWVTGMTLEVNFDPNVSIDIALDEIPPRCAPNDTTFIRLHHMMLTTRVVIHWLEDSFS